MIYLDYNATTPLGPEVREEMERVTQMGPLNPSSVHRFGQKGRALFQASARQVADVLGVDPEELTFTSGATEGLNHAIGALAKGHVITSSLEHIATLKALERSGQEVTYLYPEEGRGAITAAQVEGALRPDTSLIVLMAANNETGVKTDLAAVAELAQRAGVPFVVDGVALFGKEPLALHPGISVLCLSGHKIYGPQGSGLLYVRKGVSCPPFIVGGPQQGGRRAGTENLPAIAGFAKACQLFDAEEQERIRTLRDHFESELLSRLDDVVIHGQDEPRVGNTSNVAFIGTEGETLLHHLDLEGICVSHGAACASGALEPSRVLLNMGVEPSLARSSLRFSFGRQTSRAEVDRTLGALMSLVTSFRSLLTI